MVFFCFFVIWIVLFVYSIEAETILCRLPSSKGRVDHLHWRLNLSQLNVNELYSLFGIMLWVSSYVFVDLKLKRKRLKRENKDTNGQCTFK